MENTFKTFDHVMVRDNDAESWRPALYVRKSNQKFAEYPHIVMVLEPVDSDREYTDGFAQCIPFEGNEHLADEKTNLNPMAGFQDGDILAIRVRNSSKKDIVIFKAEGGGQVMVYRYWNRNDASPYVKEESLWTKLDDIMEVEKVSEVDLEMFLDYMRDNGEIWHPDVKEIEEIRWKPKIGDYYWTIDLNCFGFNPMDFQYKGDTYQDALWKTGNMYQTQKEAEKVIEELRKVNF